MSLTSLNDPALFRQRRRLITAPGLARTGIRARRSRQTKLIPPNSWHHWRPDFAQWYRPRHPL